MHSSKVLKRKPLFILNGLRFCFFLLFFCHLSIAQTDSSNSVTISAGTEYFDLFRQSSDRSRTIIFSKHSYLSLAAAFNRDSIFISLHAAKDYAALSQTESGFNASLEHSLQSIRLGYAGSFHFIGYSIMLGVPLNTVSHPLIYQANALISPFGPVLDFGVAIACSPFHYNNTILFQDFFVPLRDVPQSTNISYALSSTPFDDLKGTLQYEESDGKKDALANGFGTAASYRSVGKSISVQYFLSPSASFKTEIGTDEFRTELIFKQNNQTFGDLLNGSGKHTSYTIKFQTKDTPLPLSAVYSFEQLTLSGIGHVESWPFTSTAASVITNRLNYQMNGTVRHHTLTATSTVSFGSSLLFVTASYHRILPDVVLEHWEPEFLVFGMKNLTRDPFSIKDVHLAGLGLRYDFTFHSASISVFGEQYIPFSTSYRTSERAPGPNQPPVPTSTRKISTDGGRRFGLSFTIKL